MANLDCSARLVRERDYHSGLGKNLILSIDLFFFRSESFDGETVSKFNACFPGGFSV